MWTRAELKSRAKANLSRYYGPALFVSFIANMFTSSGSGGSSTAGNAAGGVNAGTEIAGEMGVPMEGLENLGGLEGILSDVPGAVDSFVAQIDPLAVSVVASILVVAFAIGLAINIFVAPLFIVGRNRYYMESRATGYSAGISELLWGFSHSYLNIVWTMFLKNLIVVLASFCCFIPGIYLGYCYYMVPYILAENPDIRATDALRMSKEMMDGHKFNTAILEFSFWGWWIVGAFACGVGGILIQPYYDATFAELYAVLRERFRGNLNGFGHSELGGGYYGPNDGPGGYDEDNRTYESYDYYRNGGDADVTQQQYVSPSERNEFAGAGQEPTGQRNAESVGSTDYGYYERNAEWTGAVQQTSGDLPKEVGQPETATAETTPRRGYYLNGVFYPYTDDELRELEENKHKN